MDPLSAALGVAVAQVLAKVWDRAGDRAVDGAEGLVGRLVERVRGRFADRGDAEGLKALATLEAAPDSARWVDAVAVAVDREAEADPEWAQGLRGLLGELERSGLISGAASQHAVGSGINQFQNIDRSNIQIDRGDSKPRS